MIDVFVTVSSAIKQVGDEDVQRIEFSTEGKIERTSTMTKLIYDETEISGFEGTKTAITVVGEVVTLRRYGTNVMEFVFEKGKRMSTVYRTQQGDFDMTVKPSGIDINLDDDGRGQINLDYLLYIKGLGESRNILNITIK